MYDNFYVINNIDFSKWEHEPTSPCYYIAYNLACAYSMWKAKSKGFSWLEVAIKIKPSIKSIAKKDSDLDYLRKLDNKRFSRIIQEEMNQINRYFYPDNLETNPHRKEISVDLISRLLKIAGLQGQTAEIDFNDLNFDTRPYNPYKAYCQSKLAMVLHSLDLSRRLKKTGVSAFSVHPGWIRSNLVRGIIFKFMQNVLMRPFGGALGLVSWYEGAQTTLHCLLDDDAPKHSGEYYSQNSVFYANKKDQPGGWPLQSPNPYAHDTKLAEKLYNISLELVGLKHKKQRISVQDYY